MLGSAEHGLWDGVPEVRVIDRSVVPSGDDVLAPFALEELLCRQVGDGWPPAVHLWRHRNALVIGLRDRQLPKAGEVMAQMEAQGCSVAVRHSGGAAVPLDAGVLNVSLILPKASGQVHFHTDFERYYLWLRDAVASLGILEHADKGEIKGSYCPGDYDVSIQGLKICGIAQRRQTRAHIVHGFILAEGDAKQRAERVRAFYDGAVAEEAGSGHCEYPIVRTDSMASLTEWMPGMTVSSLRSAMLDELGRYGVRTAFVDGTPGIGQPELESMIDQLRQRYAKK